MNNFKKINDRTLDLWAKIMRATPRSRVILSAKGDDAFHQSIRDRFAMRGIAEDRVTIIGIKPLADFLSVFNEIDIAFDTFPFSGCITVYHGLYAGVPSIVLEGVSEYERNGAAVMRKVGLPEWVARSEKEYLDIALLWTLNVNNINKLAKLRSQIPSGFKKNEAEKVTRCVEEAFEKMAEIGKIIPSQRSNF